MRPAKIIADFTGLYWSSGCLARAIYLTGPELLSPAAFQFTQPPGPIIPKHRQAAYLEQDWFSGRFTAGEASRGMPPIPGENLFANTG
jgi:hypothetical protein